MHGHELMELSHFCSPLLLVWGAGSPKSAMMETDFDRQTEDFLRWFGSLPGSTFHADIAIRDLRGRGAGRGIGK